MATEREWPQSQSAFQALLRVMDRPGLKATRGDSTDAHTETVNNMLTTMEHVAGTRREYGQLVNVRTMITFNTIQDIENVHSASGQATLRIVVALMNATMELVERRDILDEPLREILASLQARVSRLMATTKS